VGGAKLGLLASENNISMNKKIALVALAFIWTGSAVAEKPLPTNNKEQAMTTKEDFFLKIDALTKVKGITPQSVSKALKTRLEFAKTSNINTAAHGPSGSGIDRVEIRGEGGRFLTIDVSPRLGVTTEDIRRHFGEETDVVHESPDLPAYLVYSKPQAQLKFGMKLGKPDILIVVILDRTEFALKEIRANSSTEKK